jgi:protease-4
MALNADTLLDRLYLKQQASKWRLLAILALVVVLISSFETGHVSSAIESSYVARLEVDGVIMDDLDRDKLLNEVRDNGKIKALIVWLDTPGGSAVGGEELYIKLREISKVKPVVAVMRTMATSAGYLTALGADYIVARQGTITGSIGVIIQTVEVTELAEKLGIKPITIKSAPLKGSPSPFEKFTPEAQVAMQDVVRDFFDIFVNIVSERRQLPREKVVALADGRVYTGRQAYEKKLVDAIGGEAEALDWLIKNRNIDKSLEVKEVKVKRTENSWLENLTQSVAQKVLPESMVRLDGLLAIWHPDVR